MSDVQLTNEQLANLEVMLGGVTFGQAQQIQETGTLPQVDPYAAKRRYYAASSEVVVENGRRIQVVTDIDGNVTRTDIGPATTTTTTTTTTTNNRDDDEDLAAAQRRQNQVDAFSRLRALLSRVGLSELEGAVQGVITGGTVDLNDSNAILFALREQPAYQRRFAGNAARAKKGLPELDPGTYVGLEEQYRQLMQSNGLPTGFYDQTDDFQKLIEGDVSPQELQDRIQQGYRRVQDADPEVRRQMRELYGVDDNALTAYFLDPTRAAPLLTRQARAAEIAARGREQGRMQLTALQAEELAARGITPEEAQARFTQQGLLSGLYTEMTGEEVLTQEQQLGATFGYDVAAQQALERRKRQRIAEFSGGGGFARTTGATSGTVETGVGTAQ
jgi:hypothetical protein